MIVFCDREGQKGRLVGDSREEWSLDVEMASGGLERGIESCFMGLDESGTLRSKFREMDRL